jgi:hypothetical protein
MKDQSKSKSREKWKKEQLDWLSSTIAAETDWVPITHRQPYIEDEHLLDEADVSFSMLASRVYKPKGRRLYPLLSIGVLAVTNRVYIGDVPRDWLVGLQTSVSYLPKKGAWWEDKSHPHCSVPLGLLGDFHEMLREATAILLEVERTEPHER